MLPSIGIGSDHRGFKLKEQIKRCLVDEWGYSRILDRGCREEDDSCDYPVYARKVCGAILSGEIERGILMCGTGIGMCIVANRFPGIRAALCKDEHTARMSRAHNDSNVICLAGGSKSTEMSLFCILNVWLTTEFDGGRHARRLSCIDDLGLNGKY